MEHKKQIKAVIIPPGCSDGIAVLYINGRITDFSTKAEFLALATGGTLPEKPDVNEIYEDAMMHGLDLQCIGINAAQSYKECIERFLRSF